MHNKIQLRLKDLPPVIWIILALLISYGVLAPGFFSWNNIYNIGVQAAPLLILAIGETMVILTEGIDLSCGVFLSFSGVACALLMHGSGFPFWLAALCGIVVSGIFGWVNGLLVAKLRMPPFIVTLGVSSIVTGVGLLMTGGMSIPVQDRYLAFVDNGAILGLRTPIVIAVIVFMVCWVMMKYTPYGRNVYALGGNAEALRLTGANTDRLLVSVYIIAGILAGIAGIIIAARTASGHIASGVGWDFDAVAATIIGGTSFEEGKGGIAKTILGVFLIVILRNGLNVAGVPNMYQFALIGATVLGAIIFDVAFKRISGTEEVC
jgi:ribose transport system permease protein